MTPVQTPQLGRWAEHDPDAAAPPRLSAPELVAEVVRQNQTRDVGALVSVVLDNLPRDFGGLRRVAQELIAHEIRRLLRGAAGDGDGAAPSVSASYDTKALDALCASSPQIAAVLAPHRRETVRSGALTIRGNG